LLAVVTALLLKNVATGMPVTFRELCINFVICNLCLFFLNLIPIPPLDGSRIVAALIPQKFLNTYYSLESFGFFLIIAIEMLSSQLSSLVGSNISLFHIAIEMPVHGILTMLFS
jgi:Zn-dependent protease